MMTRRCASKLLAGSAFGVCVGAPSKLFAAPASAPSFSCMLWTLEDKLPFDRCVEIVAAAGYAGVELVGEFHKWSPAEQRRILHLLQQKKLVVDATSGVQAGFAVPDATDAFLAQCKAQLNTMQALGCRRMILLSGPRIPSLSPEQQTRAALDNLQRACDLAETAGVEVLIEPIDPLENPSIFLTGVAEAFRMVRALHRSNLRVLYDLYHEQRSAGNLLEKLIANLDLVGLLHVADVPGRHQPGTGEIRYDAIYRTLAEKGYAGWIAMEFLPSGDPESALRTARVQALTAFQQS